MWRGAGVPLQVSADLLVSYNILLLNQLQLHFSCLVVAGGPGAAAGASATPRAPQGGLGRVASSIPSSLRPSLPRRAPRPLRGHQPLRLQGKAGRGGLGVGSGGGGGIWEGGATLPPQPRAGDPLRARQIQRAPPPLSSSLTSLPPPTAQLGLFYIFNRINIWKCS